MNNDTPAQNENRLLVLPVWFSTTCVTPNGGTGVVTRVARSGRLGGAGPNWEQFQSAQVPSQLEPRSVLDKPRVDYTVARGPP